MRTRQRSKNRLLFAYGGFKLLSCQHDVGL